MSGHVEPAPTPRVSTRAHSSAWSLVLTLAAVFVAVSVLRQYGLLPDPVRQKRYTGRIFGTTWQVIVVTPPAPGGLERAINVELERLNEVFSAYAPTSEISRINACTDTGPRPVSGELAALLALSIDIAERSAGAFDPTVGPLIDLWGFGPAGQVTERPDPATLAAVRDRIGHHRLTLADGTLAKGHPELRLDLGAVAKGWAVDRISELLIERGHLDHLVEIGGEVRCRGHAAGGGPWVVGIQRPAAEAGYEAIREVILNDRAIATSGEYRKRHEIDGEPVSHTIDPRSGQSLLRPAGSVSVLATTCAQADAWATALNVLGPEAGLTLADTEGLAAMYLVPDAASDWQERTSRAWPGSRPVR